MPQELFISQDIKESRASAWNGQLPGGGQGAPFGFPAGPTASVKYKSVIIATVISRDLVMSVRVRI